MEKTPAYNIHKPAEWRRKLMVDYAKNVLRKEYKSAKDAYYMGLARSLKLLTEIQRYYRKDKSAVKIIESDYFYLLKIRNKLGKELFKSDEKSQPRVKKAAPKKSTPKKAAPKKSTPKKAAPKKSALKKAAPKKAAPKKAAAKKPAKQRKSQPRTKKPKMK